LILAGRIKCESFVDFNRDDLVNGAEIEED
jgi:hypothetical protein